MSILANFVFGTRSCKNLGNETKPKASMHEDILRDCSFSAVERAMMFVGPDGSMISPAWREEANDTNAPSQSKNTE